MKPVVQSFIGVVLLLLLIALSPVIVPILVPLLIGLKIRSEISLRRFRRRESGSFYLICTRRKNWYDFIRNNVVPVLPENVRVVWESASYGKREADIFVQLRRSNLLQVTKPYLVFIRTNKISSKSLSIRLQKLKTSAAKSEATQKECAHIILDEMNELRTGA